MAPSELHIIRATRKPFYVDAVYVTAEQMYDIAKWCGGEIRGAPEQGLKHYVKVPVEGARNERQTRAYVGDLILRANSKFKVYTHRAYLSSFDEVGDRPCGNVHFTADNEPCVLSRRHMTCEENSIGRV